MKLLNIDKNAKTVKGQKKGYVTGILYLAPYMLSGKNVCPMAEKAGCINSCLNTAGQGAFSTVQKARIEKTQFFHEYREGFMKQLVKEITALIRKAGKHGMIPVVRLNGTSDLRWENVDFSIDGVKYKNIMELFPQIQFYDYTKIPNRKNLPKNYHLTYSYSPLYGKVLPEYNVAVVFRGKMPDSFLGRKVIDGDENDLRFLDKRKVVVGLKAKGKARKDKSGFIVEIV